MFTPLVLILHFLTNDHLPLLCSIKKSSTCLFFDDISLFELNEESKMFEIYLLPNATKDSSIANITCNLLSPVTNAKTVLVVKVDDKNKIHLQINNFFSASSLIDYEWRNFGKIFEIEMKMTQRNDCKAEKQRAVNNQIWFDGFIRLLVGHY